MAFYDDLKRKADQFKALNPHERSAVMSALLANPFNLAKMTQARDKALAWSKTIAHATAEAKAGGSAEKKEAMFRASIEDGPADAMRHCYWSALLSRDLGYNDALAIVVTHEFNERWGTLASHMDILNDVVGIGIGSRCVGGADAALQIETLNAVRAGQLVILSKDGKTLVKLTSIVQIR